MDFIALRMKEMDFENYTFKPLIVNVPVVSGNPFLQINIQNEYYYLVSKTVPATLAIVSDQELQNADESAAFANYNYANQREFTGNVTISATGAAFILEFMRVIPRIKLTPHDVDVLSEQQLEVIAHFQEEKKEQRGRYSKISRHFKPIAHYSNSFRKEKR